MDNGLLHYKFLKFVKYGWKTAKMHGAGRVPIDPLFLLPSVSFQDRMGFLDSYQAFHGLDIVALFDTIKRYSVIVI